MVGRRVKIVVSDPWEFQTENGPDPVKGQIMGELREQYSVALDRSVSVGDQQVQLFVSSARYEHLPLSEIANGRLVPCCLTGIANPAGADPFELARKARGGTFLLGAISEEWRMLALIRSSVLRFWPKPRAGGLRDRGTGKAMATLDPQSAEVRADHESGSVARIKLQAKAAFRSGNYEEAMNLYAKISVVDLSPVDLKRFELAKKYA